MQGSSVGSRRTSIERWASDGAGKCAVGRTQKRRGVRWPGRRPPRRRPLRRRRVRRRPLPAPGSRSSGTASSSTHRDLFSATSAPARAGVGRPQQSPNRDQLQRPPSSSPSSSSLVPRRRRRPPADPRRRAATRSPCWAPSSPTSSSSCSCRTCSCRSCLPSVSTPPASPSLLTMQHRSGSLQPLSRRYPKRQTRRQARHCAGCRALASLSGGGVASPAIGG